MMKQTIKYSSMLLGLGIAAYFATVPSFAHHTMSHGVHPFSLLEPVPATLVPSTPIACSSACQGTSGQNDRSDFQYHAVEVSASYGFAFDAPARYSYESEVHFERDYFDQGVNTHYGDYDEAANYDAMVSKARKRAQKRERDALAYNYAQNFGGYGPAHGYLKRKGIGSGLSYAYNAGEAPSKKRKSKKARRGGHHAHGGNPYAETYDPGLFKQYGNPNGGY